MCKLIMLIRKLHFCSVEVKVNLFRAYFTPLYTAPLWVNYKSESLRKLKVAYNDALRVLLKKPRGVSQLFCSNGLTTFQTLLRNLLSPDPSSAYLMGHTMRLVM